MVTTIHLAERAAGIGESATLQVARRAGERKAAGIELADLGAGEPDFPSPSSAVAAAQAALDRGFTKYTPAAGTGELRAALAARYRRDYGAPWEAAQTVVTVGAKAALFELALALFEPGDEVVIPSPCWVSFPEQVRFTGAVPVRVPTAAADGFRVRAEAVRSVLTARTRAIILNSPCNPTGGVIGAADLEAIVAAAAARGALVVCDETYERFVFDGAPFASGAALAARYPETVVLVGSFSKTYSMTGWRVGYLAGPPPVVAAVIAIQSHATSNPTSFAMAGALEAMTSAEAGVREMIAEYQARRDLVRDFLGRIPGVACRPPAGAFYAFPRVAGCFRPGREGSIALAEFLLEEARVVVVPGIAFGADEHVRISFACSRRTLEEGLARMVDALAG